jgi:hypothetical protein
MKYITIIVSLCAALCFSSVSSAQDAMSVWTASPIVVDGHLKDWPSFFRFYISGAKLQFDFYNDSANLYLCVKAVDAAAQARIMHTGLDIWFDPLGKKKHTEGITFPMKLDRAPGETPGRSKYNQDPANAPSESSQASRLREHVLFSQTMIKVTGIANVKEPVIPLDNKYGIQIAYDWDSLSILGIEYKIPLSLIFQHPVSGADLQHTVGLGLVVGADESAHAPSTTSAPGSGGGRGGGGGMGGGGGRGGGGRGGNSAQNNLANDRFNEDTQAQKVWLKVHLESKAE